MGKMKTLLEDYYINDNFYEENYISKYGLSVEDEYLYNKWLEQEEAKRIAEIKSNRLQKINDLLNEKED